nr:hypothetical protein [Tanacetum cinerariifolium]
MSFQWPPPKEEESTYTLPKKPPKSIVLLVGLGNFRDTIDIGLDVIHPVPVASVIFPAATVVMTLAQHEEVIRGIHEHFQGVPIQEELTALRNRVDIVEAENASLLAMIRTMEAVETITQNHERLAPTIDDVARMFDVSLNTIQELDGFVMQFQSNDLGVQIDEEEVAWSKPIDKDTTFATHTLFGQDNTYVGAAGASKMTKPNERVEFCHRISENIFDGVNISIPRKVVQ